MAPWIARALSLALPSVLALALAPVSGCKRENPPPVAHRAGPGSAAIAPPVLDDVPVPAVADAIDVVHNDVTSVSARPPVLIVRLVNASSGPLPVFINPDINEMVHTRKLWTRRNPDASQDSDPVKFFPIGQMPLCTEDAGAGYGGLGQPERRVLASHEVIEFPWDGLQRNETLDPTRGVCAQEVTPERARYRFQFDQPYNPPVCSRPVIQWPLEASEDGGVPVVEIRCLPRPRRQPGEEAQE